MGYVWLWDAFLALSSCRTIGMSSGPIPWTAVQRYAEVEGMTLDETWILHAVIRHMDQVLVAHQAAEQKAAGARSAPRPHKPGRGGHRR